MKKPYRLDKLAEFVGKDEQQIKEMITIFLETIPPDIDQLTRFAEEEDWQKLYEIAHRIKPSFDVFEMEEILGDIKNIEKLSRENNIEGTLLSDIKEFSEKFSKIILLLQLELEQ